MSRRHHDDAYERGVDTLEEYRVDWREQPPAPTPTQCKTLAMLIGCAEPSPEPVPKSWAILARRLVSHGLLKRTGAERVFRTTGAGVAERKRLEGLGVVPAVAIKHRYAHDGEETTLTRGS